MRIQLIKRSGARAVYRACDFGKVDAKFIEKIRWPKNLRGMILIFKKKIENEQPVLAAIPGKYWITMCYSAHCRSLKDFSKALPTGLKSIKLKPLELRKLYLKTQGQFYLKWRKLLGAGYVKECQQVADNILGSAKTVCLTKNGKPVALFVVVRWKDYMDVPVNWVVWVWINHRLPVVERRQIRGYISGWMKSRLRGRVQCVINAFNVGSQIFFKRLGFVPECLHYVRSK